MCRAISGCLFLTTLLPLSMAHAQAGSPGSDPFPTLDFADRQRSIIVELDFADRYNVELASTRVVNERTHGRAGDPPLLAVEISDTDGRRLETLNAWHPLWVFAEDATGRESRIILPNGGSGRITTEFRADVAEMQVTDIAAELPLISVNLLKTTHPFCRENPDDLDCLGIANNPPSCIASVPAETECSGAASAVRLDGSASFDVDDDPIERYDWSGPFIGGVASGETTDVRFESLGEFLVALEIEDDFAGSSRCDAHGAIVDTAAPVPSCNNDPSVSPPDAPLSYTATAADSCAGALTTVVKDIQCYRINGSGKRIDAGRSCRVSADGDTLEIRNTGGVGNHIEWTVETTDASGNTGSSSCALRVDRPG